MFRRKDTTSTSGRAQAKGRAELQRQVEERLGYWRLFLEAKLQEVEERRSAGGLVTDRPQPVAQQETPQPVAPQSVQRAGATRTNVALKPKPVESDDELI